MTEAPPSEATLQYVALGACVRDNDDAEGTDTDPSLARCAVEPGQCHSHNGEAFVPAFDIQANTPAAACVTLDQVQGARCHDAPNVLHSQGVKHPSGAAKFCVNGRQNSCHEGHKMNHTDVDCNLVLDTRDDGSNSEHVHPTQYSKCDFGTDPNAPTDPVCRWDEASICPGGVPARKPYLSNRDCTCDKVQTGACLLDNGDVVCAVSLHACGPGGNFLHPHQAVAQYNVDCRLCPADAIPESYQDDPAASGGIDPGDLVPPSAVRDSGSDGGMATGAAVVVGLLVVSILVVPLFLWMRCRQRRMLQQQLQKSNDTVYKDEAELPTLKNSTTTAGLKNHKDVVDLTDVNINDDSTSNGSSTLYPANGGVNGMEQGNGEMA
mmetsp:Transcript_13714/g.37936  ORF Transcript_13714/g.37936 Transcript_13714/m.37936 type:complete len:379 (+) Transcript_13714:569-1705(+)